MLTVDTLTALMSYTRHVEHGCSALIPHLLVHDPKDSCGVVVVEGLVAGTDMFCVVTSDNSSFSLRAAQDVPIGHKVALHEISAGQTILKYGADVGRAVADIPKGAHLHVHNVKTKRW